MDDSKPSPTLEKIKREIQALFDENESLKAKVRDLELGAHALSKATEALFYHGLPPNPSQKTSSESPSTDKPWVGNLHHSQTPSDDWGFLRDENGDLILIVKPEGHITEETLQAHRNNKTDPTQSRVDYLLEKLNT